MDKHELERLTRLETRIVELAKEFGLLTTKVSFEVVPYFRVIEAMAYNLPENFSHWVFGREYDRFRTIYEHTGFGLPYEIVWNFKQPRAFLMNTNPFPLQVLTICHVLGHVDFFLANNFLKKASSFGDMAEEARAAAQRFRHYEKLYGKLEVEKTIDAAMSIQWHQHPDAFFEEEDETKLRERLIALHLAKLEKTKALASEFKNPATGEEIVRLEHELQSLEKRKPPAPMYDLLGYLAQYSPLPLKPWQQDVLAVVRHQARYFAQQMRTKMLNEGWATYWHLQIMRKLFEEGLLTAEEHGVFMKYHAGVIAPLPRHFNWYNIGLALFENIKERWDKGRFGKDYAHCDDAYKLVTWDTNAGLGNQKLFEVRSVYSDRMAVEEFFTDEFIHQQKLYLYEEHSTPDDKEVYEIIVENDPEVIRKMLVDEMTNYGIPSIVIENANFGGSQQLYLKHNWSGFDLDLVYRDLTLVKIFELWGRKVYLETIWDGSRMVYWYDGRNFGKKKI